MSQSNQSSVAQASAPAKTKEEKQEDKKLAAQAKRQAARAIDDRRLHRLDDYLADNYLRLHSLADDSGGELYGKTSKAALAAIKEGEDMVEAMREQALKAALEIRDLKARLAAAGL